MAETALSGQGTGAGPWRLAWPDWLRRRMRGGADAVAAQRERLALWLPVFMACGIGAYFSLPVEPGMLALALAAVAGTGLALPALVGRWPLLALIGIALVGFATAGWRTLQVAAPVLSRPYYGAVEGRVVGLSRSQGDAPRILLDEVYIPNLGPTRTPATVRVALYGPAPAPAMVPGTRVTLTARLSPPNAPVEPGGFDFRKLAWFDRLGAVGYTRTPLLRTAPRGPPDFSLRVYQLRIRVADHLRASIPGPSGAFAAAIIVNDRSGVDPALTADLRASNLSHLLAISGLHMGLLTGFVFLILRGGMALVPGLVLVLPTKKIAAVAALAAGAGYLVMSGAQVSTERSFIMVAVVLVAVMLDRPAFNLRAVAYAALIVLARRPESLGEAGFQMSFAATAALVATFSELRRTAWWQALQHEGRWRLLRPVVMLAVTSTVAGLATAPFSAFHFNRLAQYGLAANLLAVPVMGSVVMPAAVAALVLAPLGLDGPALWVMGRGIDVILWVAHQVAVLPGAVRMVPTGSGPVLPLVAFGGLVVMLWLGRGRLAGLLPLAAALVLWMGATRPDVLVSDDGRLVGALTDVGRALNTGRGHGFHAETWLENDGDPATQQAAAERPAALRNAAVFAVRLADGTEVTWLGRADRPGEACHKGALVVVPKAAERGDGPCLVIGSDALERLGSIAASHREGAWVIEGTLEAQRHRPWTDPAGTLRRMD